MVEKIIIDKEALWFGDVKLNPPFTREKVDAVLGEPRIKEEEYTAGETTFHHVYYYWDSLGIHCSEDDYQDHYDQFVIDVAQPESGPDAGKPYFTGKVMIGKKEYTQVAFKLDDFDYYVKRVGPFEISTYLPDKVDEADDPEMAKMISTQVEIIYHAPRPKTSIYDLKKAEEPVLKFDSFPFKLMVIEELMYEQGVLEPKFDIYDFAEKNTKREIDVDDEGYDIIPEAKKWFKDYEIPTRYAEMVTELLWDGGLKVFSQIWPFWDGEDDTFDVKRLTEEEVSQFPNLKKVITMGCISKKAVEVLKNQGIEVEE